MISNRKNHDICNSDLCSSLCGSLWISVRGFAASHPRFLCHYQCQRQKHNVHFHTNELSSRDALGVSHLLHALLKVSMNSWERQRWFIHEIFRVGWNAAHVDMIQIGCCWKDTSIYIQCGLKTAARVDIRWQFLQLTLKDLQLRAFKRSEENSTLCIWVWDQEFFPFNIQNSGSKRFGRDSASSFLSFFLFIQFYTKIYLQLRLL